jgi:3-dehydroquinate synthase II
LHSYILVPGNRTRYLSELNAGDEVLVVNYQGGTRSAVLGRVKIETRPLILLEVQWEGRSYNIILQNAETVRMVTQGKPRSIGDLSEGDEVLLWVDDSARHFGMKVDETIIER